MPTVGVIFENIIPNSNNTNSTDHDNFTNTFWEQLADFKVNNIRVQYPTIKKPDRGKFENVDAKVNDAENGAHINIVETK